RVGSSIAPPTLCSCSGFPSGHASAPSPQSPMRSGARRARPTDAAPLAERVGAEVLGERAALLVRQWSFHDEARQIAACGHWRLPPHVELEVVHRRDALAVALSLVDARSDAPAVRQDEIQM